MKIREIQEILNAKLVTGEEYLETEVKSACGCDMMSDVLAFVNDQSILITGLVNPQVVRTALMMDMKCIVFVRGKQPDGKVVDLARENDMVILTTDMRMYKACGELYVRGLQAGD